MYSLPSDHSLTTRQADKGGRMVIMDTNDYNESINAMLSNELIYKPLPEDPTVEIQELINNQIYELNSAGVISDKLSSNITTGEFICPHFYGLPKIHKPTPENQRLPPFRGIVSSVKGPTTRASYWLDSILNPIVPPYCDTHWCKDTLHLLNDIETLNSTHNFDNHTIITIDVVDMYNSIPHADGVAACKDALQKHSSFTKRQIDLILELISLVLTNNCFSFQGKFYRQIRGTAMGSPFAPAYANIFMNHLWHQKIVPVLPLPLWLKRFLDDIIAIYLSSVDTDELLRILNSCHDTTKFTISGKAPSQPYLDATLSIANSKLHSELYSKPTDSHRFLPPSSCHPGHIFRSIVYSGALRIRRICSRDDPFLFHLEQFRVHLRSSGYSSKFLDPILSKVAGLDRATLLKSSGKETLDRTLIVTTYDPRMPDLKQLHIKHQHILEASKDTQCISSSPLVALKRPANIGNLIIRTKSPSVSSQAPQSSFGHHPCAEKRCLICKDHRVSSHRVVSGKTGESFPIRHNLFCSSSHVIYSLTCSECAGFQYTGKTSTSLRQRFNFHKSCVRGTVGLNPKTQQPYEVDLHFQQPGHSISHMRIQAIEQCTPDSIAKCESKWMHLLKCHRVVGGPNIDEPFIKGLLRSLNS